MWSNKLNHSEKWDVQINLFRFSAILVSFRTTGTWSRWLRMRLDFKITLISSCEINLKESTATNDQMISSTKDDNDRSMVDRRINVSYAKEEIIRLFDTIDVQPMIVYAISQNIVYCVLFIFQKLSAPQLFTVWFWCLLVLSHLFHREQEEPNLCGDTRCGATYPNLKFIPPFTAKKNTHLRVHISLFANNLVS